MPPLLFSLSSFLAFSTRCSGRSTSRTRQGKRRSPVHGTRLPQHLKYVLCAFSPLFPLPVHRPRTGWSLSEIQEDLLSFSLSSREAEESLPGTLDGTMRCALHCAGMMRGPFFPSPSLPSPLLLYSYVSDYHREKKQGAKRYVNRAANDAEEQAGRNHPGDVRAFPIPLRAADSVFNLA